MQSNTVVHDDGLKVELEKELYLGDAISDLPPVSTTSNLFFFLLLFILRMRINVLNLNLLGTK